MTGPRASRAQRPGFVFFFFVFGGFWGFLGGFAGFGVSVSGFFRVRFKASGFERQALRLSLLGLHFEA